MKTLAEVSPELLARHAKLEAERKAAEAEHRAAERRAARERKGIPARFVAELDGAEHSDLLEAACLFVNSPHWLLVLAGPVGTGKTFAACAFLDESAEKQGTTGAGEWITYEAPSFGRFVSARAIASADSFGEKAQAYWRDLRKADRLVIDDLGSETHDSTGRSMSNLVGLLTDRHADDAKTLITTNLTAERFRTTYCAHDGGRLWDRVRSAGVYREFTGQSRRRPVGE
jgi:DNA replication protein DnaC